MSLRILDLRGTTPPFDAVLPRPSAPGADVHDVVAEILRQVRAEGDEAVVRYTAELDRVDVSDGLRVPPAEIEKACAERRSRPVARRSRWPSAASWPTTRTRARRPATWSTAASRWGT